MKLDDDGVKKLTFAVLDQALKDYTDLLKSGKESNYSGSSLKEIERFFIGPAALSRPLLQIKTTVLLSQANGVINPYDIHIRFSRTIDLKG